MKNIAQKFFVIALLLIATTLPALADDQFAGTLLGAGVGGAIGNSIGHGAGRAAATAGGVVVGGYIGNQLTQPVSYAYATGSSASGDMFGHRGYSTGYPYDMFPPFNGDNGYQPNYVAQPEDQPMPPPPVTYIDAESGNFCRQFSQLVRVGNRVEEDYGTACLGRDGSWHAN